MDKVKNILIRFGFWIILGVWLLALVVIRIFLVGGVNAENNQIKNDLEARRNDMDSFVKKGNEIKNDKWIAWEKKNEEKFEKETEVAKDFFRERDKEIEKLFPEVDPKNPDWSIWLDIYGKKTKDLVEKVKDGGIELLQGEKSFSFFDWKNTVPEPQMARVVQKQFWLQDNLADIILDKSLNVSHLIKIDTMIAAKEDKSKSKSAMTEMMGAMAMGGGGATGEAEMAGAQEESSSEESNKVGGMYIPMPFKLEVIMKFETVNSLMQKLLESPWNIDIKSISIVRVTEGDEFKLKDLRRAKNIRTNIANARMKLEESENERGRLENAVWLTLECEAKDFDLGERNTQDSGENQPKETPANNNNVNG